MNITRSEFYTSVSNTPDDILADVDTLDRVMALYNIISVQDYTNVTILDNGVYPPNFSVKFTSPELAHKVISIINNQRTQIYGKNILITCLPGSDEDELIVRMDISK